MTLKALRSHRDFEPEAQMLQSLSYGLRMMSLRAHSTGTILVPGNRAVLVYRISWATEPESAGLWNAPYANVGVLDSRGTGTTTSCCCIWVAWVQAGYGGGRVFRAI